MQTGGRIGQHEISGDIGFGGMGDMCRAGDTKIERPVALKILGPVAIDDGFR